MKLLAVFVVAVVFWTSCDAVPECSEDDDPTGEVELYENPDDCATFYECSHGTPFLLDCPDGLYYDTSLETCNYASDVDCGTRPLPTVPRHQ